MPKKPDTVREWRMLCQQGSSALVEAGEDLATEVVYLRELLTKAIRVIRHYGTDEDVAYFNRQLARDP